MAVAAPDASNEKFSLLFRGPLAQPLSQDTYQCEHKEMGQFAIFIVPVCGKDTRRGRLYEAVFNRTASNSSQVS
jgi:hypothetical protein